MRHDGRSGLRRGGADRRATTRRPNRRSRGSRGTRSATIRGRSTRSRRGCRAARQAARAALDAALHDLCGKLAGVPVYRLLGLRAGRPADLVDDLARRPRRHGAPRRGGREGGFQRLKLKLGGRDGLDVERVRAVRVAHRAAAPGRRQRVLDARRGARRPAADGRARSTASSRCPPATRRARAEAPLAGPDLRRRGLPHARRRRAPAPSARTGSTSSSRSPAGSARPCGWCTPPARSGSA